MTPEDPFSRIPKLDDAGQPDESAAPFRPTVVAAPTGKAPRQVFVRIGRLLAPVAVIGIGLWMLWPQKPRVAGPPKSIELDERVKEREKKALLDALRQGTDQAPSDQGEQMPLVTLPAVLPAGDLAQSTDDAKKRAEEVRGSALEVNASIRLVGSTQEKSEHATSRSLSELATRISAEEAVSRAVALAGSSQKPEATQSTDEAFLAREAKATGKRQAMRAEAAPASTFLAQGTVVRTVLLTGVNSDMPGAVTAMVTSDVYDTLAGRQVLIARGSKLVGRYNTQVAIGQERLLVAMTRLIRPDGSSVDLSATPGVDRIGQSGLPAEVNNHFMKLFGTSFMIGAASMLLPDDQNVVSTANLNGSGDISAGSVAAIALAETLTMLLARNRNIVPTLTIEPGTPFAFLVAHDLVMPPVADQPVF